MYLVINIIGTASCDSSCQFNAGCLGPNNSSLCGLCDLVGNFDPCMPDPTDTPSGGGGENVGVVVIVVCLVTVLLVGLGVLLSLVLFAVCRKKWHQRKIGTFNVRVSAQVSIIVLILGRTSYL